GHAALHAPHVDQRAAVAPEVRERGEGAVHHPPV
ncbi:MAG: hypothetical protein AVDCRST_MAG89-3426, partial [uncultured Gemmatimonadetes bacterium]